MAGPEGVQGVRLNPPPPNALFLNTLWKLDNLVSVRPSYFIFMRYFRKWDKISKANPLYLWAPFSRTLDPPRILFNPITVKEGTSIAAPEDNIYDLIGSLKITCNMTFCLSWSGFKLFAKVISRWQKSLLVRNEVMFNMQIGHQKIWQF